MLLLDLTFQQPEMNLAFDEALLEQMEQIDWQTNGERMEWLRFWEPKEPLVVMGRSTPLDREINLEYCRQNQIPVLRRCSGGATIVTGAGCLMYALLLCYHEKPDLRLLDKAHQWVMTGMQKALANLNLAVDFQGTCDLTIDNKKVSGNSLRCRRYGFLYHGTMICDFDLSLVSRTLRMPVRQPEYRQGRDHGSFLTRLPTSSQQVKQAIIDNWKATPSTDLELVDRIHERAKLLAAEKYASSSWTNQIR